MLNPDDDLSRGIKVCEMSGRWMNGPAFLREPPEEWPTEANIALREVPEKKIPKPVFVLQPIPNPIIDPILRLAKIV
jgi:hypothetical protein